MTVRFAFLVAAACLAGCVSATTPVALPEQAASNATAPRPATQDRELAGWPKACGVARRVQFHKAGGGKQKGCVTGGHQKL